MEHEANHPALVLMSLGNQLRRDRPVPSLASQADDLVNRIDAYLAGQAGGGDLQVADLLQTARRLLLKTGRS